MALFSPLLSIVLPFLAVILDPVTIKILLALACAEMNFAQVLILAETFLFLHVAVRGGFVVCFVLSIHYFKVWVLHVALKLLFSLLLAWEVLII